MKKTILVIVSAFSIITVFSQAKDSITLNDLNIPTSPAFVLMDKSPASIEKPSNPKALSLSLINLWQGNGAIEFTPYWLTNKPAYTFEKYLNNVAPILQTFAISTATTKDNNVTKLSLGFRTQLLRLYSDTIKNSVEIVKRKIIELLSEGENIDEEAIKDQRKELNKLLAKKELNLEIAGAYLGQSSTNQSLSATKAGFWVNFSWTPGKFPLDFTALARYSWAVGDDVKQGVDSSFFDYGLNISFQQNDFDLQVEYVNRRNKAAQTNYDRMVFIANYQIVPGIVAVASFGKDFDKVNNVFTALGVKFGLSKEKVK